MDSNKPAQNIQDSFLNTARKERAQHHDLSAERGEVDGPHPLFRQVLRGAGGERSGATHLQARHLHRGDGAGGVDARRPRGASGESGGRQRLPPGGGGERFGHRRIRRFRFGKFSSQEIPRQLRAARRTCASRGAAAFAQEPERERAFLVGIDVRTRGRSGARERSRRRRQLRAMRRRSATAAQPKAGVGWAKSNGKPSIPEFDADESLAELRTLAESAGAKVVGEILQRRDRPDPATLIGAGKLEEIAGAAASVECRCSSLRSRSQSFAAAQY